MVEIKNLKKIYKIKGKSDLTAVNDVTLTLPDKGMVFIVGKSGSGKSTLLNLIGGLDSPTSGEIIIDGNIISKFKQQELTNYRSSHISFIFQDYHILESLTVKQNIGVSLDLSNEDNEDLIANTLHKVDLSLYGDRYPDELSGGQKQRVAIARALVKGAKIVLCDEPTGNLDKKTTIQVLDLLKKISQEFLVVIVSHSILDANNYADRIIELSDGCVVRDRERRTNYSNEFKIENNIINIPHYNDLTTNELILINQEIQNNDDIQFKQIGNRFYETKKIETTHEFIKFYSHPLNRKTTKRLFKAFFKDKRKSIFISILITSLLLICFAIFQSFLSFDGNKELSKSLSRNNITVLPLQKAQQSEEYDTYMSYITRIDNDEIAAFKDSGYKGDIFYKYNTTLPITTANIDGEMKSNLIQTFRTFYANESLGVINCDEKYVKEFFGEYYNIIYGPEVKPYGIYITDYIADSILVIKNAKSKEIKYTREDLFGEYTFSKQKYGYINGIIETGYRTKYKELVDKIDYAIDNPESNYNFYKEYKDNKLYLEFVAEALNFLAFGYSFESNYEETIKTIEYRDFIKVNNCTVSLDENTKTNVTASLVINHNEKLQENEIKLSISKFNSYFGTNYKKPEEYLKNEPVEFTITIYQDDDRESDVVFTKTYKVVGLVSGLTSFVNMNYEKEIQYYDHIKYGLYIGDHSELEMMLDIADKYGFVICSTDATKLATINKVHNIFGKFFLFIELFFLLIAIIFIVNVGLTTIKKNRYDIGVLKAIGIRNFDIMRIFIRQTIIMCFAICIVTNIGIYFGTMAGNYILVSAFEEILDITFYDLKLISYIPKIVATDLIYIGISCLISFIIPQLLLFRIKPIDIIRAKE